MKSLVASQPEDYKPLIKRSFRLYRASFSKVIGFACLLAVIVFLPRLLLIFTGNNAYISLFSPLGLLIVLCDLIVLTLFIAILWHMHCVIIKKHEPLIEDLNIGLHKVVLLFIALLIQGLIFFLALGISYGIQVFVIQFHDWLISHAIGMWIITAMLLAQFFFLAYVASLFLFLAPIIAIENKGILIAVKRSIMLVWNHWWRSVSVQLTPWLSYLIVLILIRYTFHINIHLYLFSPVDTSLGVSLLQLVLFALFIPWVASLQILQLRDLELRNKMTK